MRVVAIMDPWEKTIGEAGRRGEGVHLCGRRFPLMEVLTLHGDREEVDCAELPFF